MRNLPFKSKLLILIGVSAAGLLMVGALGLFTLRSIKLDGDLYKEIKMGQDVLADYVPPPEGIAYVVTILVNMEEATDRTMVEENIKDFHQARKDFEGRHSYYMANLPDGNLKRL